MRCEDCGNECELAYLDDLCCKCFDKESFASLPWCDVCTERATKEEAHKAWVAKYHTKLTDFI